jgi:hypothetical protein
MDMKEHNCWDYVIYCAHEAVCGYQAALLSIYCLTDLLPTTVFFGFCTVFNPVLLGFHRQLPLAKFSFLLIVTAGLNITSKAVAHER